MPLKVMYLDDEIELCNNFVELFESDRVHIVAFTNPTEAMAAAKASPPDLMFIDYRLPSVSGDQVAQALDPKIPKILVTGDISVVTSYRFVEVLSKPYREAEILKIFDRFGQSAA